MKVSIITPFYKGNAYMTRYLKMLKANAAHLNGQGDLEVILVNDSPDEEVHINDKERKNLSVKILDNEKNIGIHASRVKGLRKARGEYVIFLDQDDVLSQNAVAKFINAARLNGGKSDVYVSNAFLEQANGSVVRWYRTKYHTKLLGDMKAYTAIGTQIISPGQCMIKKSAIPDEWQNNIIRKNGADDYFLWLLLIANQADFSYIGRTLYKHCHTNKNLSADTVVTDTSTEEFVEYLKELGFDEKMLDTLKRQTAYKADFRKSGMAGKVRATLENMDLFVANLYYKLRTHTGYGFNR